MGGLAVAFTVESNGSFENSALVRVRAAGTNYPFLTSKERDVETGLDYFLARYYSSLQGRFTGVDPDNYQARLDFTDPQSWNAYSYVNNNPLVRVDPDGKGFFSKLKNWLVYDVWGEEEDVKREEDKRRNILFEKQKENGGVLIIENLGGDLIQVDPARMTRLQIFFWTNRLMDIHEQGGGSRPIRPDEMVHMGNSMTGRPVSGPSGRVSTEKYLENNWDRATFGNVKNSIKYHVTKHGKGLSEVEYTQRAVRAFNDPSAVRSAARDIRGRAVVKVVSNEGTGLFTKTGRIIWFHPK